MTVTKKRRRKRRPRMKAPATSRSALVDTLRGMGLTDQARKLQIFAAYGAAVGDRIARKTEPFGFSRGVLSIRVQNAAWQQELQFMKQQMIDRINAALEKPAVRDIRIMAGHVTPAEEPERFKLPELTPQDRERARQVGREIEDEDLRETFERMMRQSGRAERASRGE